MKNNNLLRQKMFFMFISSRKRNKKSLLHNFFSFYSTKDKYKSDFTNINMTDCPVCLNNKYQT